MKKGLIKTELIVKNNKVSIIRINGSDYISLTDLAKHVNPEEPKIPIQTWMRNKNVISFLGLWEQMHNSNFKGIEFETFKNEAYQIIIFSNLETKNADLIANGLPQKERLITLN